MTLGVLIMIFTLIVQLHGYFFWLITMLSLEMQWQFGAAIEEGKATSESACSLKGN